jgi:hypothetical protein
MNYHWMFLNQQLLCQFEITVVYVVYDYMKMLNHLCNLNYMSVAMANYLASQVFSLILAQLAASMNHGE